ncbi:MAG: glycosyltransferase family 4 protein [Phycisphaeraceae bacterium]
MHLLHVITRLILGGAQQNTVLCCKAQVAAGHRVTLVYGPIYGPEGSLLEEAKASGAELREIRWMRRAVLPMHDWLCGRALRRLIRELKPDVVHTHSSKAGIIGRGAAWKERVPAVVHTIHGLPFHERQSRLVNAIYTRAERWAAKRCHKLIGVTQAMCDEFLSRSIGTPEQFTVIPSGMDIAPFEAAADDPAVRQRTREELDIPQDAPVVGIVARLDQLKGQTDLLDVLPDLRKTHPNVRLLFVGEGWHRAALEEQVKAQAMRDAVIFTGLVSPARVPSLIAAMDVHALPSYQEGQPRALVQALLTGVPVVGYDAGGIRDVCLNDRTGILVPLGDRAKLAEAIRSLLNDAALRRRFGETGRAFARERYDARIMVEQLQHVYEEVLSAQHKE